ncbi:MAG: SGNH/GDSL hydrolase family protein [Bdellovibrionales bacterium]
MNIFGLSCPAPFPKGILPPSVGGTGEGRNLAKTIARVANYKNTPIYPSVFAYPPTQAVAATGTIATGPLVGWDGTQLMQATTAYASGGQNIITINTTYAPLVRVGMTVWHIMSATSVIPDGTTVTAVNTGTGAVTLSQNLTGTLVGADYVGFGNNTVSFLGAYAQPYYTAFPYTQNAVNAEWTAPPFAVEFDYYGTAFNLIFHDINALPRFWLWVDGQPTTAAYGMPGSYTPSANNRAFYNVTFDNGGDNTARWRRIRIYMINARFGGMKIGPTDIVCATRQAYPKIAWLGDSWTEGVTGTGYATDLLSGTPHQATALLGLGVPMVAGQGSTGYISTGGAQKPAFGDSARVAPIVAANPDALMIWGSINDAAQDPTAVQNAAYALYASLQRQLPQTKLLAIGVQARGASTSANDRTINQSVKAAAVAAGVPYLDCIGEGWVMGSGKYGATTGMGNADVILGGDGAHLQQTGCEYYARRIAAWLAEQI